MNETQIKDYFFTPNIYGVTPFYVDVAQSNPQALELIQQAKNLQITPVPTAMEGFSVAHVAAQYARLDFFKKICETPFFDINATDKQQRTPLHIAAIAGRLDILIYLLQQGANLEKTDHLGLTALRLENQPLDNCYIKFSAKDLLELYAEFDPQRLSKLRLPYPFATREVPAATEDCHDIIQMIKKQNLTGDFAVPINTTNNYQIPNFGHFIWIGSVFRNPVHRENILSYKKNFPELTLIIWVEHTDQEFLTWCQQHQLIALSVNLLLNKEFSNVDLYLAELQKNNPAGATDHLRLEIIYRFGGWYFDTDVRCEKPVTQEDYKEFNTLVYGYVEDKKYMYWNNCLLACNPKNKYIQILIRNMGNNYFKKRFVTDAKVPSGFEMRFLTSVMQGPGNLAFIVALLIFEIDQKVSFTDATQFVTSCDIAWMDAVKPEDIHIQKTPEEAKWMFKTLVNNYIYELMLDPENLYLDLYEHVFKKYSEYHLARLVLHFLVSFLPQSMEKVKKAIVLDTALEEINYKNKFGNRDIIVCNKPNLAFYHSEFRKYSDKQMKYYDAIDTKIKNRYFYHSKMWDGIRESVLYNDDKVFADAMTLKITEKLMSNEKVAQLKGAKKILEHAWQTNKVKKMRNAILEVGEMAIREYPAHEE